MFIHGTDENFKENVKEGVVLVDFYGVNCGPCKMLEKVLEDLDDEFPFVNILKMDTDECVKTSDEFNVNGIPDVYFFKDGEVRKHMVGASSYDEIKEILSKLLYE